MFESGLPFQRWTDKTRTLSCGAKQSVRFITSRLISNTVKMETNNKVLRSMWCSYILCRCSQIFSSTGATMMMEDEVGPAPWKWKPHSWLYASTRPELLASSVFICRGVNDSLPVELRRSRLCDDSRYSRSSVHMFCRCRLMSLMLRHKYQMCADTWTSSVLSCRTLRSKWVRDFCWSVSVKPFKTKRGVKSLSMVLSNVQEYFHI